MALPIFYRILYRIAMVVAQNTFLLTDQVYTNQSVFKKMI